DHRFGPERGKRTGRRSSERSQSKRPQGRSGRDPEEGPGSRRKSFAEASLKACKAILSLRPSISGKLRLQLSRLHEEGKLASKVEGRYIETDLCEERGDFSLFALFVFLI